MTFLLNWKHSHQFSGTYNEIKSALKTFMPIHYSEPRSTQQRVQQRRKNTFAFVDNEKQDIQTNFSLSVN